jgi:hypothetical protein
VIVFKVSPRLKKKFGLLSGQLGIPLLLYALNAGSYVLSMSVRVSTDWVVMSQCKIWENPNRISDAGLCEAD